MCARAVRHRRRPRVCEARVPRDADSRAKHAILPQVSQSPLENSSVRHAGLRAATKAAYGAPNSGLNDADASDDAAISPTTQSPRVAGSTGA